MGEGSYYNQIKELNIAHYTGEVPYYTKAPLREVEKKILSSIPKKSEILDVGCGSGRFTIGVAQMGHNVTGIDITRSAIIAAARKAESLKLNDVHFLVGDMTEMPFESNQFDYMFCPRFSLNAVATFRKRQDSVSEMVRVVKHGGTVYVESFNKFYLGQGLWLLLKNILTDVRRKISMIVSSVMGKEYTGLLIGDIVYESNKVAGAPKGYAHLPTILELKKLVPHGATYQFYSIPQITEGKKIDVFKYFRYSIWIFLTKTENTHVDKRL